MNLMSETIGKLSEALSLAQAEFKPAIKDSKNPFFKSNYADLTSIVEASRAALTKYGLAISQVTNFYEGVFCLQTILSHKSGEFISGMYPLKPVKDDPQGQGSCISYARRYAYASICGVVTGEDDDGEMAHGRVHKTEPTKHNSLNVILPSEIYNATIPQKEIIKLIMNRLDVPKDPNVYQDINACLMGKKMSEAESVIKDYLNK